MKIHQKTLVSGLTLTLVVTLLTACVQYPTERSAVVDQRPQISFRVDPKDTGRLTNARVLVDGLDAGRVADLAEGFAALRVLPGTHLVQVVNDGQLILEERVYLGDGIVRPFIIK